MDNEKAVEGLVSEMISPLIERVVTKKLTQILDVTVKHEREKLAAAKARIAELEADNKNLRSVMIAAAEEIDEHWDAHCDADGYGPANLMGRLERGIPSVYAYKSGDFRRMAERIAALEKALGNIRATIEGDLDVTIRDLVNGIGHPNDLYADRDKIAAFCDDALLKEKEL